MTLGQEYKKKRLSCNIYINDYKMMDTAVQNGQFKSKTDIVRECIDQSLEWVLKNSSQMKIDKKNEFKNEIMQIINTMSNRSFKVKHVAYEYLKKHDRVHGRFKVTMKDHQSLIRKITQVIISMRDDGLLIKQDFNWVKTWIS